MDYRAEELSWFWFFNYFNYEKDLHVLNFVIGSFLLIYNPIQSSRFCPSTILLLIFDLINCCAYCINDRQVGPQEDDYVSLTLIVDYFLQGEEPRKCLYMK